MTGIFPENCIAKKLTIASPISLFILFATYLGLNFISYNFHSVIPQQIYRSKQLNNSTLLYFTKKYHIKSIINLRGKQPKSVWYKNETTLSHKLGLKHYDLDLSAHKLPTKKQLRKLMTFIQFAPKPILIHCKNGADRSGLAAAMSVILSGNHSLDDAEDQISWQYDALSPSTVGYQVFMNYFAWLKKTHQHYGKSSFIQWVNGTSTLKNYSGWFFTCQSAFKLDPYSASKIDPLPTQRAVF